MKACFLLLVGTAFLVGCGTLSSDTKTIDWKALEAQARSTGPLQFAPEYEPVDLRIPLLFVDTTPRTGPVVGTRPTRIAPLGVSLGNGLAIDSQGAIFLDVLKLLPPDLDGDFSLTFRSSDLFRNTTLLSRKDGVLHLSSPLLGNGTVSVDADGLSLKSESGADRVKITSSETSVVYKSSVPFDPSCQLSASADTIQVKRGGLLGRTTVIQRDGQSVQFNTTQDVTIPIYDVSKSGDAYLIEYRQAPETNLYTLYFAGRAIYLVLQGNILLTVEIGDSAIRVNGRVVASWTVG